MRCLWVLAIALLATSCVGWAQEIPSGTVIPVMLTMTIDSDKVYAGQQITAKVMDTVPLASEGQIPAGSKVFGHVEQVKPGDKDGPAWVAIQFDHVTVRGRDVPLKANVRALASMMAVYDAQVPFFEPDTTPRSAVMLAPVGGDPAFRPDNPEKASRRLVHFSGELPAGCGGRVDRQGATGALWVFSPYACGVYGYGKGLVIVRDGSTDGTIVLGAKKDVQVHSGSGFLLQAGGAVESAPATESADAQ